MKGERATGYKQQEQQSSQDEVRSYKISKRNRTKICFILTGKEQNLVWMNLFKPVWK